MGVPGAWKLLFERSVKAESCNNLKDILGWREKKRKIHVDLVGSFYQDIKRFFIDCDKFDGPQKILAAQKFLNHLAGIIPKDKCVLYVNGSATEEQSQRIEKGISNHSKFCRKLEQEIKDYNDKPNKDDWERLVHRICSMFRFTHDLPTIIYKVASEQGWSIVQAKGEAQVAIGMEGGIVLSGDSDMLFYPNIDTFIKPLIFGGIHRQEYRLFHKSSVLSTLELNSAAFTAMGILSDNEYDRNLYGKPLEHVYSVIQDIQQANPHLFSIRQFIEAYIAEMNARTGKSVVLEDYIKSYRIFVLQEEHLQPLLII
ncbi:hypothetical protein FB192DRAFT_1470986 [Mucor lusitanicus]|uniref:XPG-I domain-containing protein n=1 Tax=Mucor circinelloides f. lusitanicus TaxID=29924 RepID=A0A8H4F1G0_MUCCL|nr:hypothetical protein FB192DRAFT_1470986 [Mucor lusitanicus]